MGSIASTSYDHQKLKWHMLLSYNLNIDLMWFQGDQDALGHPQQPRQAQLWQVQQV